MKITLAFAGLLLFTGSFAYGQGTRKGAAFEVAAIKACKPGTPEPPGEHAGMAQFTFPGGRFEAKATTVKFLIEWAYDILPLQHSGGPSWVDTDRFDIFAKAPGGASDSDMKAMARTLLTDRFGLRMRQEKRDGPILVLGPGKAAPKLVPAKDGEQHSIHVEPVRAEDRKIVSYRAVATRFSFADLTQTFARLLDRVIVNETGMNGEYDFTFVLTPDENNPNPLSPELLIAALRDQMGLAVRAQRGMVEHFVIERVERPADEK